MSETIGNLVLTVGVIAIISVTGWMLSRTPVEAEAVGIIPTVCTEVHRRPYIYVCTVEIGGKLTTCVGSSHGLQCNL